VFAGPFFESNKMIGTSSSASWTFIEPCFECD
jgi:hypothetical protein